MAGFKLVRETLIPLEKVSDPELSALISHWNIKRGERLFALRSDFDPVEMPELRNLVRIVMIEAEGVFRFRFYGSQSTNPDRVDMTGKTTREYKDTAFGEVITRHYQTVADDGIARCWHISANVDQGRYEYLRAVLPISYNGKTMDSLLVRSVRIENENLLWRQI